VKFEVIFGLYDFICSLSWKQHVEPTDKLFIVCMAAGFLVREEDSSFLSRLPILFLSIDWQCENRIFLYNIFNNMKE